MDSVGGQSGREQAILRRPPGVSGLLQSRPATSPPEPDLMSGCCLRSSS
jgi:hypothetical protein